MQWQVLVRDSRSRGIALSHVFWDQLSLVYPVLVRSTPSRCQESYETSARVRRCLARGQWAVRGDLPAAGFDTVISSKSSKQICVPGMYPALGCAGAKRAFDDDKYISLADAHGRISGHKLPSEQVCNHLYTHKSSLH